MNNNNAHNTSTNPLTADEHNNKINTHNNNSNNYMHNNHNNTHNNHNNTHNNTHIVSNHNRKVHIIITTIQSGYTQ